MPCAASTSRTAPSQAARLRDTSYVKSTCPGVSIMLRTAAPPLPSPSRTTQGIRTACDLMVMPRSRSMSIRSRYCARICRGSTTPVICSMRSARVDLPWSMCAMMQKLRMRRGSVAPMMLTPGSSGPGTVVRSSQAGLCQGRPTTRRPNSYRPTPVAELGSHPFSGTLRSRPQPVCRCGSTSVGRLQEQRGQPRQPAAHLVLVVEVPQHRRLRPGRAATSDAGSSEPVACV